MVRGTLGPAPPVEPITANQGATECATQSAGGAPPAGLPGGATGSLAFARTRATAPRPTRRASASRGPGSATADPARARPARAARRQRAGRDVPGFGTIDIDPAIQALAAPTGDLVDIRALDARVTGQCSGGRPVISGTWSIAGLSVLGVPISTDDAVSRTLAHRLALDRPVEPQPRADRAARGRPVGVRRRAPARARRAAEHRDPRGARRLQVTPGQQVRGRNTLTQRALTSRSRSPARASLDFVAGEATVGGDGVGCGEATADAGAALHDPPARADRRRPAQGPRAAARRRRPPARRPARGDPLHGHRRRVARPRVGSDGLFRATAKLPPAAVRDTNRARESKIARARTCSIPDMWGDSRGQMPPRPASSDAGGASS